MARRYRRPVDPQRFDDPLSDYSSPDYEDAFETFLSETEIQNMEIGPFLSVTPQTSVGQVLGQMDEQNLFCALIVEEDRLIGIFSERDVLNRVASDIETLRECPIRQVMTENPVTINATDTPAKALNMMAEGGFRHLPVLDIEDRLIGILGPRRVTRLLDEQFVI